MPLSDSSGTFRRALRPKPSPAVLLVLPSRRLRDLPVLVHQASRRVWGLRLRRTKAGTRDVTPDHVAFRQCKSVGVLIASFRSSIPSPPLPLFSLRRTPHGVQRKTRGRAVRYSFLVGLLHSLLHAGCSENIIRLKERLLKIQRHAPLGQGAADIADDDERDAVVGAFAASYQHHGMERCSST